MPHYTSNEWQKVVGNSKIGQCDGKKIASLKCNLFASLRPVYFAGQTIWLCGRCLEKLNKRARMSRPVPRH